MIKKLWIFWLFYALLFATPVGAKFRGKYISLDSLHRAASQSRLLFFSRSARKVDRLEQKVKEEGIEEVLKEILKEEDLSSFVFLMKKGYFHGQKEDLMRVLINEGKVNFVKTLFAEKGIDINHQDVYGRTFLHQVLDSKSSSKEEMLLYLSTRKGVDVNIISKVHGTPLQHAVAMGSSREEMNILLQAGTNLNTKNLSGLSVLHIAGYFGNVMAAKLLLKEGANLEIKDNEGQTPLAKAVFRGQVEMAKFFVGKGANTLVKLSKKGDTLLHIASLQTGSVRPGANRAPSHEMIQTLLKTQARSLINEKDSKGETPLFRSVAVARNIVTLELLKNGAQVETTNHLGETPFFLVAGRLLLKSGAMREVKPNELPQTESTKVSDYAHMAFLLLHHGAQWNRKRHDFKTPVHLIMESKNFPVLDVLLNHVIKKDKSGQEDFVDLMFDRNKENIFHLAMRTPDVRTLKTLLSHFSKEKVKELMEEYNKRGLSPLNLLKEVSNEEFKKVIKDFYETNHWNLPQGL